MHFLRLCLINSFQTIIEFMFQIAVLINIFKVQSYVLGRSKGYLKSNFRVLGISQKMGWRQVEHGFSSLFAIFDDFSKFCLPLARFSLKNHQIWQKKKKRRRRIAMFNLPSKSTHFSMMRVPESRVSCTRAFRH